VFDVDNDRLGVRFVEPVADPATGRRWRVRYSASLPLRGAKNGSA